MKVVLNTSVAFDRFGGISSHRAVEVPNELIKPFINNGIAFELNDSVPTGTKISFPISIEFLPKVEEEKPKKRGRKAKEDETAE